MAYPDYSIVIISVTTNGVTEDYAQAFFNDELAKKYYNQAVSEGKRAFYFEKPRPTRFVRNDDQPLKSNAEKGLENQPLPQSGTEQNVGTIIKDVFRNTVAGYIYYDAYNDIKNLPSVSRKVGEETWTKWIGFLNLAKVTLTGTEWSLYGTVALEITESNKRIRIKHDGSGGFLDPEITKLWPNKDEITWTPPLDQNPIQVVVEIEGQTVNLGTKRNKKVHDGTPEGGTTTEVYTFIPAGFTVLETETKIYRSNGMGWYNMTEKANSNCDPQGTVLSSQFNQDLMYPIIKNDGLEQYIQIGQQYIKDIANGDCTSDIQTVNTWSPNGTVVFEDETTYWKSNGTGGVYTELKNNGGGDTGGDGDGGNGDCPPSGTILETVYEEMPPVTEYYEGVGFVYSQGLTAQDKIANGTCGYSLSEPARIEYNEEGTFLGYHNANGNDYYVSAGPNGSAVFEAMFNAESTDNLDGLIQPETTTPSIDYPSSGDCVDPIPAGYPPDLISTSCFKSANGSIVGTLSVREIVVTLPQGYYNNGVMGLGGAMPSNTKVFKTGNIWSGRFLSDGNCGWTPEDDSPTNDKRWTFPATTSLPAGMYINQATVATSGAGGTWFVVQDMGPKKNSTMGERVWRTQKVGFRHDGKGNITTVFK